MTWKYASPRRRLETRFASSPPAYPSDYLAHLLDLLESQPELPVVLYCRKSLGEERKRHQNLAEQAGELQKRVEQLRVKVLAKFRCWECSYELDADNRGRLVAASEYARRHGAVLVAETTDRFLRHPDIQFVRFGGTASRFPTVSQFEKLRRLTGDVTLATFVHPDESGRSHQTRRGQQAKGRRGGRPRKRNPGDMKQRKVTLLPQVIELRQQGASFREIAAAVDVPVMTLYGWIRPE